MSPTRIELISEWTHATQQFLLHSVICIPLFGCVPGVWGVWGRDEFGVTGILGVKGFAAGFNVYFFGAFCCFSDEVDSTLTLPGVC